MEVSTRGIVAGIAATALVVGIAVGAIVTNSNDSSSSINSQAISSGGCKFITAPDAVPALCDTFDSPTPAPSRSGDLNSVLWGVSRATSAVNISQGVNYAWASSTLDRCGTKVVVDSRNDVQICNGQVVESVDDNEGQTVLAMYPRQPFDFAGRTGVVAFDVSNNTQGPHGAWPAFALTDQPVPAPYDILSGVADNARNSVGISFADACQSNGQCDPTANHVTCVGVDLIYTTTNYAPKDMAFTKDGCVKPSTQVTVNNHVEIQFSETGLVVWMSDAGAPSTLKKVAHASFAMPLTRGLPWMEDVHYNGNKFNQQRQNTFSWDNFAFDGPFLARDLGTDILDNTRSAGTAESGLPLTSIGYPIPQNSAGINLTFQNVSGTTGAASALLELTFWPQTKQNLTYSFNGGPAHVFAWPFGNGPTFVSHTVAMPVTLSEIHDGNNTLKISTSDKGNGVSTANYDLIIVPVRGPVTTTTTTTTTSPSSTTVASTAPDTTTVAPTTSTTLAPDPEVFTYTTPTGEVIKLRCVQATHVCSAA